MTALACLLMSQCPNILWSSAPYHGSSLLPVSRQAGRGPMRRRPRYVAECAGTHLNACRGKERHRPLCLSRVTDIQESGRQRLFEYIHKNVPRQMRSPSGSDNLRSTTSAQFERRRAAAGARRRVSHQRCRVLPSAGAAGITGYHVAVKPACRYTRPQKYQTASAVAAGVPHAYERSELFEGVRYIMVRCPAVVW